MTTAQASGKDVSLTHRQHLPPGNSPGTHFFYRMSRPQGQRAIGRIMSMKNSNDTIADRTSDLPICSTAPQPLCHRGLLTENAMLLLPSLSPLCRVFIHIFLKQTMSLGNSVSAILSLLFMVSISLVLVLALLYFYVSTFRSMCAVRNMAGFCSSFTSWFPGVLLMYFLNDFEMVPVAPIITGITLVFYRPHALYFYCQVLIFYNYHHHHHHCHHLLSSLSSLSSILPATASPQLHQAKTTHRYDVCT